MYAPWNGKETDHAYRRGSPWTIRWEREQCPASPGRRYPSTERNKLPSSREDDHLIKQSSKLDPLCIPLTLSNPLHNNSTKTAYLINAMHSHMIQSPPPPPPALRCLLNVYPPPLLSIHPSMNPSVRLHPPSSAWHQSFQHLGCEDRS